MRGEGEKQEQDERTYPYCICPGCKVKLHVYATHCWKCGGKKEELIYRSKDKGDELYSKNLNNVEKCMACFNVLQRNSICEPIICFGTGRGSCDFCRRANGTRFECCQQAQKEKPISLSEALKEIIKDKSPMAKTLVEALQPQFEDDIPF